MLKQIIYVNNGEEITLNTEEDDVKSFLVLNGLFDEKSNAVVQPLKIKYFDDSGVVTKIKRFALPESVSAKMEVKTDRKAFMAALGKVIALCDETHPFITVRAGHGGGHLSTTNGLVTLRKCISSEGEGTFTVEHKAFKEALRGLAGSDLLFQVRDTLLWVGDSESTRSLSYEVTHIQPSKEILSLERKNSIEITNELLKGLVFVNDAVAQDPTRRYLSRLWWSMTGIYGTSRDRCHYFPLAESQKPPFSYSLPKSGIQTLAAVAGVVKKPILLYYLSEGLCFQGETFDLVIKEMHVEEDYPDVSHIYGLSASTLQHLAVIDREGLLAALKIHPKASISGGITMTPQEIIATSQPRAEDKPLVETRCFIEEYAEHPPVSMKVACLPYLLHEILGGFEQDNLVTLGVSETGPLFVMGDSGAWAAELQKPYPLEEEELAEEE